MCHEMYDAIREVKGEILKLKQCNDKLLLIDKVY